MNSTTASTEWNDRYDANGGHIWSGKVNEAVEAEAGKLERGTVLDVGCGEGADVIWLVRNGFTTTGVDVSDVAIERARAAAEAAGVEARFEVSDVISEPPSGSYDLLVLSYPALKTEDGESTLASILQSVAPGGRALFVFHVLTDETEAKVRSLGFEPGGYVGSSDVAAALADGFVIEVDEQRDRTGIAPDALHKQDRVIVARRC